MISYKINEIYIYFSLFSSRFYSNNFNIFTLYEDTYSSIRPHLKFA